MNETDDRMTDELEVEHYQTNAGKADPQLPYTILRLWLDSKTVGFFFSKSVKKSVKRGVRVLRAKRARLTRPTGVFLAPLPSLALCFQPRSRPFV